MLAFKPHWYQISAVLRNGRFKHVLKEFPGFVAQGGGGWSEQLQAAGMDFLPMVVAAEEQS